VYTFNFPSFDGTNFHDWRVKELKSTLVDQREKLLLLSMVGKAVSWQRRYIHQPELKNKSWQKILQDVACRFDDSVYDDPITELSRLTQEEQLEDYLEVFYSLLAG